MPRRYELTWDKANKRWKKFYKGKQYYFPFGTSKTDMDGYRNALDAWHDKKAELDANAPLDPHVEAHRQRWMDHVDRLVEGMKRLEENDSFANRDTWQQALAAVELTRHKIAEGVAHPTLPPVPGQKANPPARLEPTGPAPWEMTGKADTLDALDDSTIGGNVKRFLLRKQQQVERGERSYGRFDSIRVSLEKFTAFKGIGRKPIESLNGAILSTYRDHLEGQVSKAEISPHYAKTNLQAVTQFVRWAWEHELLELPRILDSKDFAIGIPERKIEVFTVAELEALFGESADTTRLYLLLMLNCGMQQQDISELRQSEVDWKQGRIVRKRSKTGDNENVPEVNYLLWPETFRLLKKHRSEHAELALTNRKGGPLKTETIVGGKVKKIDNIRSAFNRVVRKLANREEDPVKIGKPLKLLRKTAATKLGEHAEFGKYAQYFLGHSPRTIADKHYVRPSEEQFDRAVGWLGKQFGGITKKTVRGKS